MIHYRSILEFGVPAWNGTITVAEKIEIERVQKCAVHIMLGRDYSDYEDSLRILNLESLDERRSKLCLQFALKAEAHPKFKSWFVQSSTKAYNTRSKTPKYKHVLASHARYEKSPIYYLTNLLNLHYSA